VIPLRRTARQQARIWRSGHDREFPLCSGFYHDKKYDFRLSVGKRLRKRRGRAYKINIRGLNLAEDAYYRGEVIERIGRGRVWETRRGGADRGGRRRLEPDFEP